MHGFGPIDDIIRVAVVCFYIQLLRHSNKKRQHRIVLKKVKEKTNKEGFCSIRGKRKLLKEMSLFFLKAVHSPVV